MAEDQDISLQQNPEALFPEVIREVVNTGIRQWLRLKQN
jgi:hypothetical protein